AADRVPDRHRPRRGGRVHRHARGAGGGAHGGHRAGKDGGRVRGLRSRCRVRRARRRGRVTMAWGIAQMRADVAPMTRAAAVGYLRRRPGDAFALATALLHTRAGEPANYAAAVHELRSYGQYLAAFADAVEGKR